MSTPQTIEKHSEVYNKIKIIVSLLDVCDDDKKKNVDGRQKACFPCQSRFSLFQKHPP